MAEAQLQDLEKELQQEDLGVDTSLSKEDHARIRAALRAQWVVQFNSLVTSARVQKAIGNPDAEALFANAKTVLLAIKELDENGMAHSGLNGKAAV